MADVATALRARLIEHTGLNALISDRVYPLRKPQGTANPCIYYEQYGFQAFPCMGTDDGVEESNFDLNIIADSYSSMKAVELEVRDAIQRWGGTQGGFQIHNVFLEDIDNLYVDETSEHLSVLACRVQHQTPA